MKRAAIIGLFLVIGLLLGLGGTAHAATFTVNTTTDSVDAYPGDFVCSDANGQCSLRAALMEANAFNEIDEIRIPPGTYTLTLGQQLEIKDHVVLVGTSNNPTNTIIQAVASPGTAMHRVLEVNPLLDGDGYNVTIQGLTIRHGKAADSAGFGGGGIGGDIGRKTLVISNSIIEHNVASGNGFGGGLFISGLADGKVQLTDVMVRFNVAGEAGLGSRGGGMYLEGDMRLELSNLTVQNNTLYGLGGGAAIVSSSPSLRNVSISSSNFSANAAFSKSDGAEGRAGGLYLGTPAVVTDTILSNNTSNGDGGGLVLDFMAGTVTLNQVTMTGNTAVRGGGMFLNAKKAPMLTNTTISGNTGGDITVNPEGTDLRIQVAPNGVFSQGKTGARYSVTVQNTGYVKSNGMVTASVELPAGLMASHMAGTGWSCTVGTLTCTRTDSLDGKSSYPIIDVTVNVADDAARTVTTTAIVSGGDELDVNNNTASHETTVLSNDASLKGLTALNIDFHEPFDSETMEYSADVLYSVSSLRVTALVNEEHATVTVNGVAVVNGQASGTIGLTVGANEIDILVTAEDGISQKTYKLTVIRAPKSTNANLSDLQVDGMSVEGFAPDTLGYSIIVPNAVTAVAVTATAEDAFAAFSVTESNDLTEGDNAVTIMVTAEDTTIVKTYTITVRRLAGNADLSAMTVNGDGIAGFTAGTTSYTINVPYGTTEAAVIGTLADANASVIVTGGESLNVGNNTVTVTVTAEDPLITKAYTITVRRLANNTDLQALTVNGAAIPDFTADTLTYRVSVPNVVKAVSAVGTAADPNASVSVTGGSSLDVGDNIVMVTTAAEDPSFTKTYTITIRRLASDANLSSLTVNGTEVEGFLAETVSYTVNVSNATTAVAVVGTVSDPNASMNVAGGSHLNEGDNTVTVTVTAEDPSITKEYTLTIHRISVNANLDDLKVDGTTVAGFAPGTTAYALTVPYATTEVVVAGTAAGEYASLSVIGGSNLSVGNNTVSITVTAEDLTMTKTYTITIRRLANDTGLSALMLNGTEITGFATETLTYQVNVPNATLAVAVFGTASDANASVQVTGGSGLNVGDNTVMVTVTAEDPTITKAYMITVRRLANDASLIALSLDGTNITGFASDTLTYQVNVPNAKTAVTVTGTAADVNASVNVIGGSDLIVGNNTVRIVVTAEDPSFSQEYTITVRRFSAEASLSDLQVDGTSVAGFDPGTLAYTVNVPNETNSVVVTGAAAHPAARVTVTGGNDLTVGVNTVMVHVTAEDDTTVRSYVVTVVRAKSNNAELSDLRIDGIRVPDFAPGLTTYMVSVPNTTTAVTVTGTTYANATMTVTGGGFLNVGNNTVTVIVLSEDTTTTKEYIITIRRVSAEASLSDLQLDGRSVAGFDPGTLVYTVNVPNSTTSVAAAGIAVDPAARVAVTGGSGLAVGNNTVTITVTAEDGTTMHTYVVTVVRAKSNNAALSDLRVNGILAADFSPEKLAYSMNVPNATTSVTVTGIAADATASVTVSGGSNLFVGDNTITLTVTAQDGTTNTYTMTVTRLSADKSFTLFLTLGGAPEEIQFSNDSLVARSVTSEVYNATVTGSVYELTTTLEVNGVQLESGRSATIALQEGLNTIVVKVTAQDRTSLEYSIEITRFGDVIVTGLIADGVALSPSFDPGTWMYYGSVPNEVRSTTVTASVYGHATVTVNGIPVQTGAASQAIDLTVGENTIPVVVTPSYGIPTVYTIVVTRLHPSPAPSSDSSSNSTSDSTTVQVQLGLGESENHVTVQVQRQISQEGRIIDRLVMTPNLVNQALFRLVFPQLPAGSDEFNVVIPQNTLQAVSEGGRGLIVDADEVQMMLPQQTIDNTLQSKEELYFRFVPLRTEAMKREVETRVLTAELVTQAAGGGKVLLHGRPVTIETNLNNQEALLHFSLEGIEIPADMEEAAEWLSSLHIYIEHSDGEKKLDKGKIIYDDRGKPVGIEIVVTKFSTFSVIEIQKNPIETFVYNSWIDGYPDGTFKPYQSITRAEAASILVRALPLPIQSSPAQTFMDVPSDHWGAEAIQQVQGAGWLNGYPDGTFRPDALIARAELAAIIVRIGKTEATKPLQAFTDTNDHWAAGFIQTVRAAGWIDGYEDGSYRPEQPVTRAEAVKVMNTLLKRPLPELGVGKWTDVTSRDWFWLDVQSASITFRIKHYADGSSMKEIIP
jgi:hypothetical protein